MAGNWTLCKSLSIACKIQLTVSALKTYFYGRAHAVSFIILFPMSDECRMTEQTEIWWSTTLPTHLQDLTANPLVGSLY